MIDVSIAIVSFNTRDALARTVAAAVADIADLRAEVIVVDNASRDGSAAMVRGRFPAVTLLENPVNTFYAAANNQAMAISQGRYVLVLNSDAELQRGTVAAMIAYLDRRPAVGALSVRMCHPDGTVQRNCARLRGYGQFLLEYTIVGAVCRGMRRKALARYWYGEWDRTTDREVDVIPGSCIMVRRDVLARVGGFDERFRLYFAEDDWCLRIKAAGFLVMYASVGTVIHAESLSVGQVRRLARRLYFEDMVRYVEKHFGRVRAATLWALSRPTRWVLDLSGALRRE